MMQRPSSTQPERSILPKMRFKVYAHRRTALTQSRIRYSTLLGDVTVTRLHLAVAAFMLAAPLAADAQQVQKVYRIGYMSIPSSQSAKDLIERVFLPAMRERGLVEGKNLVMEWRWAEGKPE